MALLRAGRRVVERVLDPATLLPLVLVAALAVRTVWLSLPPNALIFDEAYYVNASRALLGWEVPTGAAYADAPPGLDPNTEHPPLGKLLIAASMAVFGDNGIGWRLPSVAAGMLALIAIYLIVRASGETRRLGILAVGLAAFDNLMLVHSRIGTLDILALSPALLGAWAVLRERWVLAGALIGLAVLFKLTAIYAVLAVGILVATRVLPSWWRNRRIRLRDVTGPLAFAVATTTVALAGLFALDLRYTTYTNPVEHLRRMVDYGASLRAPVDSVGVCPEADSDPAQWLFNECQITYLRVDVTVRSGETVIETKPSIDFRGAMNPVLAAAIPIASLFAAWYAVRRRSALALWALAWAAANYLPYVLLALVTDRIMYLYYFLPTIPAVAIALAIFLMRDGQPRAVRWGFIVAYGLGFAAYFPFRQIP